jgi:UDP-2-acetamido-3-amino-2,3-dideoxy-glucuronate N-acetyltransferase
MSDYFVHPSSVVDEGAVIGAGTKIWHFSHIMPGAKIGKNCVIGQSVFIGSLAVLGDNVHVHNNVSVYDKVICEDDVFLGPSMVFTNDLIPRSAYHKKSADEYLTTYVERGATIGANATVVCGVRIGRWAFVGAGAVVTKDVEAYSLVMGNPAKHYRYICECGSGLEMRKEGFEEIYRCGKCGRRYRRGKGGLEPLK